MIATLGIKQIWEIKIENWKFEKTIVSHPPEQCFFFFGWDFIYFQPKKYGFHTHTKDFCLKTSLVC